MLAFEALVRGRVTGDGPDGSSCCVPRGHCRVQSSQGLVRVWWQQDGGEASALLTAPYFEACLESGAILIMDAAQIRDRPERSTAAR